MNRIVEHSPKTRFFEDGYLHIEDHAGRESTEYIRAQVLDLSTTAKEAASRRVKSTIR